MDSSPSRPLILVTGAAGKTGQAVVGALRARDGAVRALVHRPEQVSIMRGLGVKDVITGDLMDRAALARAFTGASSVYHICPNMHPDEVGIGERVMEAARGAGAGHFVYHSVLHPQTENMPHHWQKLRVEERLLESGLPFTILQPAPYMQNVLAFRESIEQVGEYPVPYAAATRLGLVDLFDVGAAAAAVLMEPGHRDAIYELVGEPALSQREVAAVLGRLLGRVVTVKEIPLEEWRKAAEGRGMGGYQVDSLVRMFRYYQAHGLTGNPSVLRWLLGRNPTTFADFARHEFS